MRKCSAYICFVIFSIMLVFTAATMAEESEKQKIKVFLNGELINFSSQEPTVVERRTLIPLRGIFEKMGYSVSWDPKTKACTISNDIQKITMRSGHKGMQVNDRAYMLDVPAQIINNSLMIPLRAVAECTGATVTWDASTKSVYINSSTSESLGYSVNEYVREYAENIEELENVSPLFKTLNSLTDKNYTKKIELLKNEIVSARESLEKTAEALSAMTPPEEYSEFHSLSIEAVNSAMELCDVVEEMTENNLTYEEASVKIGLITEKANEINKKVLNATAELNMSVYR